MMAWRRGRIGRRRSATALAVLYSARGVAGERGCAAPAAAAAWRPVVNLSRDGSWPRCLAKVLTASKFFFYYIAGN